MTDLAKLQAALHDGDAAATVDALDFHERTDSLLLGYQIGSAETEHGRFNVVGSGNTVRFTLDGKPGYVDLNLAAFADTAFAWLARESA